MKNYKVCILAAGLGSRSFNPDINKALLPLKNKAIISHIIDNFDIKVNGRYEIVEGSPDAVKFSNNRPVASYNSDSQTNKLNNSNK